MKHCFKIAFLFVLVGLPMACGGSREKRLAQDLESLKIAHLRPKDITVTSFDPQGKNEALLEADVRTAFLMKKNARGEWEIQSIRVGDRRWENMQFLTEALNRIKAQQVQSDFKQLADAIEKFQAKNHQLPAANGIAELIDLLYPAFLPQALRLDPWSTEYDFQLTSATSYRLVSAGPDRKFGTADDIRFEH